RDHLAGFAGFDLERRRERRDGRFGGERTRRFENRIEGVFGSVKVALRRRAGQLADRQRLAAINACTTCHRRAPPATWAVHHILSQGCLAFVLENRWGCGDYSTKGAGGQGSGASKESEEVSKRK